MPRPTDLPTVDGKPKTSDGKQETAGDGSLSSNENSKAPAKKPDFPTENPEAAGSAPDKAQAGTPQQTDGPQQTDSRNPSAGKEGELRNRINRLRHGHPSSPRNADGSLRPEPVDLRDLESADEPDVPQADSADSAEEEGGGPGHANGQPEQPDAIAAGADGGAGADWRAQVPRLQGIWERHKGRWPEERRPPVDRSNDEHYEEASWRGDTAGQYLNAEENLQAEHTYDRVSDIEQKLTGTLHRIEADVPGTRLVGLAFRLKGIERFKEKIADDHRAMPDRSIDEIAGNIHDAVRYTYQMTADRYVDGYREVCERVKDAGYQLESSRNFWSDTQYKGINTRWRTDQDQLFEIQFHTPESFEAKQITHDAYERIRLPPPAVSSTERKELRAFQAEVSAQVAAPNGVIGISNYSKDESRIHG